VEPAIPGKPCGFVVGVDLGGVVRRFHAISPFNFLGKLVLNLVGPDFGPHIGLTRLEDEVLPVPIAPALTSVREECRCQCNACVVRDQHQRRSDE
jgi:hypothetical protein